MQTGPGSRWVIEMHIRGMREMVGIEGAASALSSSLGARVWMYNEATTRRHHGPTGRDPFKKFAGKYCGKDLKLSCCNWNMHVSPHINNNKECICKSAIIVCKESLETGCSFTSGTGRGVLVAGPSEDFKTGPDFRSRGSSRHACPLGIKTHFAWLRTEEEEEEGGGWVEPWNVQTFPVDCFLHWLHLGSARTTCALGLLVSIFQEGKRKIFF